AVEHRDVSRRPTPFRDGAADRLGLLAILLEAPEANGGALAALGPEPLLAATPVVGNERRGDAQNAVCRAVVPLQRYDPGAGKVLVEAENVLDFRAAPAVDRLVLVAD